MKTIRPLRVLFGFGVLFLLFSIFMLFESDVAYAKPMKKLPNVMTENECKLNGGKIVDGLRDGILCCIETESELLCNPCPSCNPVIFKSSKSKLDSGKLGEKKTDPTGIKLRLKTDVLRKTNQ